jgi:hypothetical protein
MELRDVGKEHGGIRLGEDPESEMKMLIPIAM